MNQPPPQSQLLIYQSEDGRIRLDVRFEGETVWLTQQLMAELFDTTQQNISLHLQNVFAEGELSMEATHKDFLLVRQEGNRKVQRRIDYYNLDAINPSEAPHLLPPIFYRPLRASFGSSSHLQREL